MSSSLGTAKPMSQKKSRVLQLLAEGWDTKQVAEEVGCHRTTVYEWARVAGVVIPPAARKHDHGKIVQLRREGLSCGQIAKRVGCHRDTVRRALESEGIAGPLWRAWPPDIVEAAVNAYREGQSLEDVGKLLGRSSFTARDLLVRNGVRIRRPGERVPRDGADARAVPKGWMLVHTEDGDEDWLHEPIGVSCTLTDRQEGPGRFVVLDPELGAFETLAEALSAVEVAS